MTRLAVLLACLALAGGAGPGLTGCGAAPDRETSAIDLGAQVTLAPGAAVSARNTGMTVRFIAVTEDSRCPRDVTCVWAGEVRVRLEVQQTPQAASQLELLEGRSAVAGRYRVTLVHVDPQPTSTTRIAPQDYRATLALDEAG